MRYAVWKSKGGKSYTWRVARGETKPFVFFHFPTGFVTGCEIAKRSWFLGTAPGFFAQPATRYRFSIKIILQQATFNRPIIEHDAA